MITVRIKALEELKSQKAVELGVHTFLVLPRVGEFVQFDGGLRVGDQGGRHAFRVVEVFHWPSESVIGTTQSTSAGHRIACLFVVPADTRDVD